MRNTQIRAVLSLLLLSGVIFEGCASSDDNGDVDASDASRDTLLEGAADSTNSETSSDASENDAALTDAILDTSVLDTDVAGDAGSSILTNTPNTTCSDWTGFGSGVNSGGPYMVARLTPASYPHVVQSFSYDLVEYQNGPCTASVAHTVMVFRGTNVVPPTSPLVSTVQVSAGAPNLAPGALSLLPATYSVRRVKNVLAQPVTLLAGEHLFIAIQTKSNGTNTLCSLVCPSAPSEDSRNYWSGTGGAPYTWTTLASRGTNSNLRIWTE